MPVDLSYVQRRDLTVVAGDAARNFRRIDLQVRKVCRTTAPAGVLQTFLRVNQKVIENYAASNLENNDCNCDCRSGGKDCRDGVEA